MLHAVSIKIQSIKIGLKNHENMPGKYVVI
jgi:hypothetical protein